MQLKQPYTWSSHNKDSKGLNDWIFTVRALMHELVVDHVPDELN